MLLDEAGAGTDPREGTSLAVSIIEYLHERGALVVATTHYNELKAFAAHFEGAENAAMEFDPLTLQPTYRIHIGLPGRSLAHAICERLGLPAPLLERARELLGGAHFSMEELLGEIEEEREQTRRKHDQARQARTEAEEMRGQAREGLERACPGTREAGPGRGARRRAPVAEPPPGVPRPGGPGSLPGGSGWRTVPAGPSKPPTRWAEKRRSPMLLEQNPMRSSGPASGRRGDRLQDLEHRLHGIVEQAEEVRQARRIQGTRGAGPAATI